MIMSSANGSNLTSSFLILMHFISSSCLSPPARTFSAMLNKSGGCGHFCLLPDINMKAFSFSLSSNMFAMVFFIYAIIVFAKSFYHERMLNFVKSFSEFFQMIIRVFPLHFLNVVYYVD